MIKFPNFVPQTSAAILILLCLIRRSIFAISYWDNSTVDAPWLNLTERTSQEFKENNFQGRILSKRDADPNIAAGGTSQDRFPTIYYICGEFPNQVYSIEPCKVCRNGGRDLFVACTSPVQCTPYYRGQSACIDGRCCTATGGENINNPDPNVPDNSNFQPVNPYRPYNPSGTNQYDPNNPYGGGNPSNPAGTGYVETREFGYCPRGERSNIRCSGVGQCPMNHICLNGMCCPRGNNDYLKACGGQMAISACMGGECLEGLVCTASDYCCQCPVGKSGGRCNQGGCAPGYRCHQNGYCCAWCPDNTMPFGTCQNNQQCAAGFTCQAGDVCCQDTSSLYGQYNQYGGYLTNGA
ncbi:hypothetical protein Ddc_15767 [Ditylenchus destructor]|nr:hypothetical protein Ddc_15767 [Ditylenchus destructor]